MRPQITPEMEQRIKELEAKLIADGKLMAGGFSGFRMMVLPQNPPQPMIDAMEMAFFAGAQHLFSTLMRVMGTGEEPTEEDLSVIDKVKTELDAFGEKMMARAAAQRAAATAPGKPQ